MEMLRPSVKAVSLNILRLSAILKRIALTHGLTADSYFNFNIIWLRDGTNSNVYRLKTQQKLTYPDLTLPYVYEIVLNISSIPENNSHAGVVKVLTAKSEITITCH